MNSAGEFWDGAEIPPLAHSSLGRNDSVWGSGLLGRNEMKKYRLIMKGSASPFPPLLPFSPGLSIPIEELPIDEN